MKAADRSSNEQPAPPAIATTNAISDLRKKNCFTTIARGAPNSDKKKTPKNNRSATVAPNSNLKKKNRSATVATKNNHSATVLYLCLRDLQLQRRKHPIAHNILASETIQSPALPLEGVDDVHRSHGLPPSVLSVGHGVSDHILEEDFEDSPGLLVDEAGNTLHASSTSQTANSRLGNPLDVVAKHLPVTLGSSLAQSLASLSTAGHFCRVKKEI
nr:histone H4 [Ipomoea batatas]